MIYLKNVRESKHMSVDELAAKTMLSKQTIWAYERGGRNPDPTALCVLADALDCSLDMLVRGKEKDLPKGRSREDLFNRLEDYSLPELREVLAYANYLQYRKEREQTEGQGSSDTQ